jgi:hypothetical protein
LQNKIMNTQSDSSYPVDPSHRTEILLRARIERDARQEQEYQALTAVRRDGWQIQKLPQELLTAQVCIAAVQQNGLAIEALSPQQRTPEVCLAAVQQAGRAIAHLTDEQRTADICLAAANSDGSTIELMSDVKRTAQVCLAALKSSYWLSWALQFHSQEQHAGAEPQKVHPLNLLTPEQLEQPEVSQWVVSNWNYCEGVLGETRSGEVARLILKSCEGLAEQAAPKVDLATQPSAMQWFDQHRQAPRDGPPLRTPTSLEIVQREEDPWAISRIAPKERTPSVCLAAVKRNGYAIECLTAEQMAQPQIRDWVEENWAFVDAVLGEDRARAVAQAIDFSHWREAKEVQRSRAQGSSAQVERARC